jgi:uncharacterized membrane protein YjjB (DUF3815 family)
MNKKLISIITSYNFNHVFAFTVEGLVPCLLSSLLVDMAHHVIVENFNISTFITSLLASHPVAARYTSIIHLKNGPEGVVGDRYVWAHKDMRP